MDKTNSSHMKPTISMGPMTQLAQRGEAREMPFMVLDKVDSGERLAILYSARVFD